MTDNKDNSSQKHSPPKLPPKSRFNDEESTAVLRLLVKQEKLLKIKDENPALRLSPEKSTRHLPPVTPDLRESIQGPEGRQKENIVNHELSYYGHLTACILGENSRPTSAGGIYQSPKLTRTKDRPKCSYGRRQQQEKQEQEQEEEQQQRQLHQTKDILRPHSRKLEERERKHSHQETITRLKEQTLKLGGKTAVSRTRSCPVNYDTNIPPISQNRHSMNWSLGLTDSMSQITLKSGQSRERNLDRTNTLS